MERFRVAVNVPFDQVWISDDRNHAHVTGKMPRMREQELTMLAIFLNQCCPEDETPATYLADLVDVLDEELDERTSRRTGAISYRDAKAHYPSLF